MTDEQRRDYIKGLLDERAASQEKGDKDHVAEVNAELQRVGHSEAKPPARRASTR